MFGIIFFRHLPVLVGWLVSTTQRLQAGVSHTYPFDFHTLSTLLLILM
jgi:hypothetical protein